LWVFVVGSKLEPPEANAIEPPVFRVGEDADRLRTHCAINLSEGIREVLPL
jgi:hypothetical protein